jgi:GNAT superfamily N-acetyltransferase
LRTHGARQTAVAIGRRLRRWVYVDERLIVVIKDLDAIVEPFAQGSVRIEDLAATHLPALAELNRRRDRPEIDRRFADYVSQGFHGFVAYAGEELVGYYWWVDRDNRTLYPDLAKLGLGIELREGEVYGSDFFLLEEHRGGGVAAELLYRIESGLRDRGYSRIWGYVASDNRPARWIYSTRGYVTMWTVHRKRILIVNRTTRESA